jgi:hypothetical protein
MPENIEGKMTVQDNKKTTIREQVIPCSSICGIHTHLLYRKMENCEKPLYYYHYKINADSVGCGIGKINWESPLNRISTDPGISYP